MDPRADTTGEPDTVLIQPFLGRSDEARAEVWLRCPPADGGDRIGGAGPIVVTGTLTGPYCSVAATLPTAVPVVDQGWIEGRPPLARAVCTEPAFWTPEVPHLYHARVELLRDGRVVAAARRTVGLRRAGTRGDSLWLDGRRFVPRGVRFRGPDESLPDVRDLAAVAVVDAAAATDALLDAADRLGVGVVVHVDVVPVPSALASIVDTCAAHPSVLLLVLPAAGGDGGAAVGAAMARRRGTLVVGSAVDGRLPPPGGLAGSDLLVATLPVGAVPHEAWRRSPGVPRVALEAAAVDAPPDVLRRSCDALQARLAAWAVAGEPSPPIDWAGFLVA